MYKESPVFSAVPGKRTFSVTAVKKQCAGNAAPLTSGAMVAVAET